MLNPNFFIKKTTIPFMDGWGVFGKRNNKIYFWDPSYLEAKAFAANWSLNIDFNSNLGEYLIDWDWDWEH